MSVCCPSHTGPGGRNYHNTTTLTDSTLVMLHLSIIMNNNIFKCRHVSTASELLLQNMVLLEDAQCVDLFHFTSKFLGIV